MGDNRDSYLIKALLDNYEEPLDISLISNNPLIPSIGNNLNTSTNQNNEKRIKIMRNDTSYRKVLQTYHETLIIKLPLNLNQFRDWKVSLIKNVTSWP